MIKRTVRRKQRRSGHPRNLSIGSLPERSQSARDRALHVLAAMRRDPNLSLSHAAKLEGVKAETVKKHSPSCAKEADGKFRVTKSDRNAATLYIPDDHGNSVPIQRVHPKSGSRQATISGIWGVTCAARSASSPQWHGKKIAGVELVTAGRTIVAIEPALSEFSLYRAFNGGAA